MDADEREIYYYLKSAAREFTSARDICRHAGGKRRYREDAEWAKTVLVRMVEKGIVESDAAGYYRLKFVEQRDTRVKRWISPQIAKILQNSGKDFSGVFVLDELDENNFLPL